MHFDEKTMTQLDELGKKWYAAKQRGDAAVCTSLTTEIFNLVISPSLVSQLCAIGTDHTYKNDSAKHLANRISNFFMDVWYKGNFDPSKAPLSKYISHAISHWSDPKPKKRIEDTAVSLSTATGKDKDTGTLEDLLSIEKDTFAGIETPTLDAQEASRRFLELLSLSLNIVSLLSGQARNSRRILMYRMFFTDTLTFFIAEEKDCTPYLQHERDLFRALDIDFMDFILTTICRTIPQLSVSQRKAYNELVSGGENRACRHPLDNKVFCAYLDQHGDAVTEQRLSQLHTAYFTFCAEHFQSDSLRNFTRSKVC